MIGEHRREGAMRSEDAVANRESVGERGVTAATMVMK